MILYKGQRTVLDMMPGLLTLHYQEDALLITNTDSKSSILVYVYCTCLMPGPLTFTMPSVGALSTSRCLTQLPAFLQPMPQQNEICF